MASRRVVDGLRRRGIKLSKPIKVKLTDGSIGQFRLTNKALYELSREKNGEPFSFTISLLRHSLIDRSVTGDELMNLMTPESVAYVAKRLSASLEPPESSNGLLQ